MKRFKENGWTDRAAGKIANTMIRVQTKVSKSINMRMKNVRGTRLKIIVLLFCVVWGGLSLYFMLGAIIGPSGREIEYKIDQIKVPDHFDETGSENDVGLIDLQTYHAIQEFKNSPEYDSVIRSRPGLEDSIALIEQLYQLQNK